MGKKGALRLLGGACLVFILIATSLSVANAQKSPEPIKLTMISAWPLTETTINYPARQLKKYIEAWSGGQIKVDFKGGPEVVAFPEIPKVVERGMFDIGYTCPPYVGSQYPATQLYSFVNPTNMRLAVRDEKLWDLMDKVTRTHGMTFLGVWNGCNPAFYHFAKKPTLDKDGRISSFKGLKIRTPGPFAVDFISALEGTPVTLHPGEVYEGIRRKLIDGTILPMNSAVQGRYWEIITHTAREGIFLLSAMGFMNSSVFDKLSPEHQKIIIEAAKEVSVVSYNYVGALTWDGASSKAGYKDVTALLFNEKNKQALTKAREDKLNVFAAAVPSLSKEIMEKFKIYYSGEDLPISTEVSMAR